MTLSNKKTEYIISKHASIRMSQRGIKRETLDVIMRHGEIHKTKYTHNKFVLPIYITKELYYTEYNKDAIDAATKLAVIVSTDGTIVTCYHDKDMKKPYSTIRPKNIFNSNKRHRTLPYFL